ncbi:alpha-amylase family glycosyl hydrolase [Streptomyces olivochromogenes]|uniref:alpha-amylase family glycosyl hydrolase n=1 Tax=Streptomyces olivochromogenes TaxID=1963 RepID=UPI00404073D1
MWTVSVLSSFRGLSEGAGVTDLSSRNPDWWRQAVVYQVYPRSFADADGDGLGDLKGITQRLDHVAALGVDALWLSPFYPSELADGGYDVADHRDVDPRLGTLDDFDALVGEAHRLGLKVIVDIVPNHTSRLHPWFQEALRAAPGSPARDRYVFRPGRGEGGELPPTDWQSVFHRRRWAGRAQRRVLRSARVPGVRPARADFLRMMSPGAMSGGGAAGTYG